MQNYSWSEPETSDPMTYSTKFGDVTIEPVTKYMPVSEISRGKVEAINDVLISIDIAEQVTLISEGQVSINLSFPLLGPDNAAYVLKYSCKDRAAVCRVTVTNFQTPFNVSAQSQIEALIPRTSDPFTVH